VHENITREVGKVGGARRGSAGAGASRDADGLERGGGCDALASARLALE